MEKKTPKTTTQTIKVSTKSVINSQRFMTAFGWENVKNLMTKPVQIPAGNGWHALNRIT